MTRQEKKLNDEEKVRWGKFNSIVPDFFLLKRHFLLLGPLLVFARVSSSRAVHVSDVYHIAMLETDYETYAAYVECNGDFSRNFPVISSTAQELDEAVVLFFYLIYSQTVNLLICLPHRWRS